MHAHRPPHHRHTHKAGGSPSWHCCRSGGTRCSRRTVSSRSRRGTGAACLAGRPRTSRGRRRRPPAAAAAAWSCQGTRPRVTGTAAPARGAVAEIVQWAMDGRRRRVSWASLARFGPGGARFQDGREMLQRVERSLIWARGRSVACADSFGGVSGYQRERGRAQYALVRATGWRGRTGGLALLRHVGAHRDGDRAPCACARGSRRGPGRSWRPGGASRVAFSERGC